jgi:hypothetical protein
LVITGCFLYWSLTPGCPINFIPFAIHQSLFKTVTNGQVVNTINEGTFIRSFDILLGILIFWAVFRISKKMY